jgi:hypothetical protein
MCVILCGHGLVEATSDLYRLERLLEVPPRLRWILHVRRGLGNTMKREGVILEEWPLV